LPTRPNKKLRASSCKLQFGDAPDAARRAKDDDHLFANRF
jgi:hypothetical protein